MFHQPGTRGVSRNYGEINETESLLVLDFYSINLVVYWFCRIIAAVLDSKSRIVLFQEPLLLRALDLFLLESSVVTGGRAPPFASHGKISSSTNSGGKIVVLDVSSLVVSVTGDVVGAFVGSAVGCPVG